MQPALLVGLIATVTGGALQEDIVAAARAELVAAGLIAFRKPFYQVLSLDPAPAPALAVASTQPRAGEARSAGDILRSILNAP
jgi:hypothetical protein